MRFTDAYAASHVCPPTRASILTGQYPARLRLTDVIKGIPPGLTSAPRKAPFERLKLPEWTKYLPPEAETLADPLRASGYATAHIGKWHLNAKGHSLVDAKSTSPEAQGFDVVADFPNRNMEQNDPKSIYAITEKSLSFIEASRDRPFFLYLSHHSVHVRLEAREALVAQYTARDKTGLRQHNPVYAGMVEHTDDSVGRVMAKLDELGMTDNAVVIFYSDNGGLSYARSGPEPTNNAPLRHGKGTLYEGGIRVPFIVRWPGTVAPGSTCAAQVSSVDFYPTILEVAGTVAKPEHVGDGVSLVPLLNGQGTLEDLALFWHYPHHHHTTPGGAVRAGNYKLIEYYEDGMLELYILRDDLGESKNLARQLPEKTWELQRILDAWRKSVDARMPTLNPVYDPAKAGFLSQEGVRQDPPEAREGGKPQGK